MYVFGYVGVLNRNSFYGPQIYLLINDESRRENIANGYFASFFCVASYSSCSMLFQEAVPYKSSLVGNSAFDACLLCVYILC